MKTNIEDFARDLAHDVAKHVALGNGYIASNAKVIILATHGQSAYNVFKSILEKKWHIRIVSIPEVDEKSLFILDTYSESHINRIVNKVRLSIEDGSSDSSDDDDGEESFSYVDLIKKILG